MPTPPNSRNSSTLRRVSPVVINAAGVRIYGDIGNAPISGSLTTPPGVIIFAHGSGSSRHSPRNQFVAGVFEEHGFTTLLLDLLTEDEQYVISKRFDIALLTTRLVEAIHWARQDEPRLVGLPVGLFGASTGAAAALRAAAVIGEGVGAVVSRGGRTDLTGSLIKQVQAPTLLIVGSEDRDVLKLNQLSLAELGCEKRLAIVSGATHLFEEQGALDDVAHLATYWFKGHLGVLRPREFRPSFKPSLGGEGDTPLAGV